MANPRPGLLSALLIAGLVTLAVTGLRLYGEVQGWNPTFFNRDPGGGMAPLGIAWLPIVFGFWFGRRLAKNGKRPRNTKLALGLHVAALALMIGGAGYLGSQLEGEELRTNLVYLAVAGPVLSLLALAAWPNGFFANLVYALLARVPVIVVQYVAIANDWGTHYEKVHPKLPKMSADERAHGLMLAQATTWMPYTILVGGLFAVLGAASVRKYAV